MSLAEFEQGIGGLVLAVGVFIGVCWILIAYDRIGDWLKRRRK